MSSTAIQWKIGQEVEVASRTWPGINKPGGHGVVVKIHYSSLGVVDSLDVKYTLANNTDTNLATDLVKAHVELDRGRRSRRSREFLKVGDDRVAAKTKKSKPDVDDDEESNADACNKENHDGLASAKIDAVPPKKRKKPRPEGPRPEPAKKHKNKPLKAGNTNTAANKETQKSKAKPNNEGAASESSGIPKYVITKGSESMGAISPLVAGTTEGNQNICTSNTQNRRSVSDEDDTCSKSRAASSSAAAPVAQNALKSVYDGHVRDATNYINSLVGPPQAESKPFSPPPAKTAAQLAEEERGHEFGKSFNNVMLQHDMAIPEEELLGEINSSGCKKLFTAGEVDRFMSQLCEQEKVMKSDGCFYAI